MIAINPRVLGSEFLDRNSRKLWASPGRTRLRLHGTELNVGQGLVLDLSIIGLEQPVTRVKHRKRCSEGPNNWDETRSPTER